jgi:hypothetical protein
MEFSIIVVRLWYGYLTIKSFPPFSRRISLRAGKRERTAIYHIQQATTTNYHPSPIIITAPLRIQAILF